MADDENGRLTAELDADDRRGSLDRVLGRLRGPDVVEEIEAELPSDAVISHDGNVLFAYAAGEEEIRAARSAIERVLERDGIGARIALSHWDEEREEWRQIDPPLSAEELRSEQRAEVDADAVETRTLVASAGKLIRASFERSLLDWAKEHGLEVKITEHPHLLTTQVLFTVTGQRRRIDEFARALKAEGVQTLRSDATLMLSPI